MDVGESLIGFCDADMNVAAVEEGLDDSIFDILMGDEVNCLLRFV